MDTDIDFFSFIADRFEKYWPYIADFFTNVWEFLVRNSGWIEIIFLLISAIFLIGIIVFIKRTKEEFEGYRGLTLRDVFGFGSKKPVEYFKIWKAIKRNLNSRNKKRMKMAVIEARHLLDNLLHEAGYEGNSFKNRLKGFVDDVDFSEKDELLDTEEIVKSLKSGELESVDYKKASEIIEIYKKALNKVYELRIEKTAQ